MKKHATTLITTLAAAVGCGGGGSHDTGQVVQSDLARVTAPTVSSDDAATLAADNLGFAVDLYHNVSGGSGANLIFSPASISIALAMAYAGAATTTASEIATTMHFSLPPERLHPAFDALDLALTAPPASSDDGSFQLTLADAIWGQQGFDFLSSFLDLLAQDYGAGLHTVDFASAPEPARMTINAWVAGQTQQQIPQLLAPGAISAATRLVLTNAVFFHGDWQTPFDPIDPSTPGTFHAPSGDVSVAMMSGPETTPVWTGAGYTAGALPYVGGTTSMILVVPDAGTFSTFEAGLTADSLTAILAARPATGGAVTMPEFKLDTAVSLGQTLAAMGMPDAFTGAADFSGIDGAHDLSIADVVHQADIAVDTKGTTAAAATAVIIRTAAAFLGPTLVADRPFLFFIRHDPTGAILFAGRVTDPTI